MPAIGIERPRRADAEPERRTGRPRRAQPLDRGHDLLDHRLRASRRLGGRRREGADPRRARSTIAARSSVPPRSTARAPSFIGRRPAPAGHAATPSARRDRGRRRRASPAPRSAPRPPAGAARSRRGCRRRRRARTAPARPAALSMRATSRSRGQAWSDRPWPLTPIAVPSSVTKATSAQIGRQRRDRRLEPQHHARRRSPARRSAPARRQSPGRSRRGP